MDKEKIARALAEVLDDEEVLKMMAAAVMVKTNGATSTVSRALNDAIFGAAVKRLKELVTNDPAFNEQVEKVYAEAFKRTFETEREQIISNVAINMARGLAGESY